MLSDSQLARLVRDLAPDARLREALQLGERTLLLALGERRRAVLRIGGTADQWAGDPLLAEAVALRCLAAEIDLAVPSLLGETLAGEVPALLLSCPEGRPLPEVIDEIDEEGRYALGQQLGALIARTHAYGALHYGTLDPNQPPEVMRVVPTAVDAEGEAEARPPRLPFLPPEREPLALGVGRHDDRDRAYLVARVGAALNLLERERALQPGQGEAILRWIETSAATSGQPPCLVHGDLAPERLFVRRRERGWQLSGVVGWGYAQAWRPGWDHATMQGGFAEEPYFSLRVGYGNAYDAATERRYDQLREFALAPYRRVLALEAGRLDLIGTVDPFDADHN